MPLNSGRRYLTLDEFIKYCGDLNLKTDSHELEHYEMTSVLLPTARVVYPDDYVTQKAYLKHGDAIEPIRLEKWPELQRLFEKPRIFPEQYANLPDAELIDPFDREFGHNSYLTVPTMDTYKHWKDYTVLVTYPNGHQYYAPTVKHYYSHWQVYQLNYLQGYPDLYINRILLDNISAEDKQRIHRPSSPDLNTLRDFDGMARLFDMLSFWITMYDRECNRTFALVPQKHHVKSLDETQHVAYTNRVINEAKLVESRYVVTGGQLYHFLSRLLGQDIRYRKDERFKLSDELRGDIGSLTQLIGALCGYSWDGIASKLAESYPYWTVRHLRHIDTATQERDEAHDLLIHYSRNYVAALSEVHIADHVRAFLDSEIDELLDYCEHNGLSILMTALRGMVATDEDAEVEFRHVALYTNLKNLLTALECLLGSFPIQRTGKGLAEFIPCVLKNESWWTLFAKRQQQGLTKAKNEKEFFNNLSTLLNDQDLLASEDTYWARTFLIAVLTRNFSAHNYPEADEYYGELFGEMLRAAVYSILYSWQHAKRAGWSVYNSTND